MEVHGALGRSDLEISRKSCRWVLELKCARTEREPEIRAKLDEALGQLRERRYGEAVRAGRLIRVALVCSEASRRFVRWAQA